LTTTTSQRTSACSRRHGGAEQPRTEPCRRTGLVVRKGIPVERLEHEIAALLEPRSPRHLFEQAEIAVVGTVIRREEAEGQADVRPPAARMQLVTLEVKEWLKGTAARDSLVIVPPAFVRGRTAWDFVEFTPGEDALGLLGPEAGWAV